MRDDAERSQGLVAGETDGAEDHAMSQVVAALRRAFPARSERDVTECVGRIHATFARARVRTYVPILVEREAYAALMSWPEGTAQPSMVSSIASASGPDDAGF